MSDLLWDGVGTVAMAVGDGLVGVSLAGLVREGAVVRVLGVPEGWPCAVVWPTPGVLESVRQIARATGAPGKPLLEAIVRSDRRPLRGCMATMDADALGRVGIAPGTRCVVACVGGAIEVWSRDGWQRAQGSGRIRFRGVAWGMAGRRSPSHTRRSRRL